MEQAAPLPLAAGLEAVAAEQAVLLPPAAGLEAVAGQAVRSPLAARPEAAARQADLAEARAKVSGVAA